MQRNTLAITTLICGLLMLSGCGIPAGVESPLTTQDTVARYASALQVVFDDMLSKDNSESPTGWTRDQSKPVYVSKNSPRRPTDGSRVLSLSDEKKFKGLTSAERRAASEVADDLIAHSGKGEPLSELGSTSGRVKVYEETGAATQPARQDFFARVRASSVFCRATQRWSVRLGEVGLPVEHSFRRGNLHPRAHQWRWKVRLRDFISFV